MGVLTKKFELVSSSSDGTATAILDVSVGNDGAAEIDKVNIPTCDVYAQINTASYEKIITRTQNDIDRKTGSGLKFKWSFTHKIDACNPSDTKVAMFGLDGSGQIVRVWDNSKPNIGLTNLVFLPTASLTSTPVPSCNLSQREAPTFIRATDATAYSEVAATSTALDAFKTDCLQSNCWMYKPTAGSSGNIYSKGAVIDTTNTAEPSSGAGQTWVKYNASTHKYGFYKLL
ncbi:MAG: hypothetical protein OYH77_05750 [Pseudomonadota bacterium]|nr:hypothetical protein [Pseudomonadota bacterium]